MKTFNSKLCRNIKESNRMKDLDYYLENICVEFPLEFPPKHDFADLTDWYGVSNESGIIAYFGNETDALRFRLDYINSIMNPIKDT